VAYAAALLPASLAPTLAGVSGNVYAVIAAVLGAGLLVAALKFASARSDSAARRLFFGSLIYLPLIWTAMIADKL